MKTAQIKLPVLAACLVATAISGCQTKTMTPVTYFPDNRANSPGISSLDGSASDTVPEALPDALINTETEIVEVQTLPTEPTTVSLPVRSVESPESASLRTEGALPRRLIYGDYLLDDSAFKSDIVYFEFDRSDLRAAELTKVEEVAVILRAKVNNAVLIDGHCDERGTEEYNRSLGERRALTIRETLISLGISPDRIHTRSMGEDAPAVTGRSENAYSRNRRGEFALLIPRG